MFTADIVNFILDTQIVVFDSCFCKFFYNQRRYTGKGRYSILTITMNRDCKVNTIRLIKGG